MMTWVVIGITADITQHPAQTAQVETSGNEASDRFLGLFGRGLIVMLVLLLVVPLSL